MALRRRRRHRTSPNQAAETIVASALAAIATLGDHELDLAEHAAQIWHASSGPVRQALIGIYLMPGQGRQGTLDVLLGSSIIALGAVAAAHVHKALADAAERIIVEIGAAEAAVGTSTPDALARVAAHVNDVVIAVVAGAALDHLNEAGTSIVARFTSETTRQLALARRLQEPADTAMARWFAPDAARLEGCPGRGHWWRLGDQIVKAAGDTAAAAANTLRSEVMDAYDAAVRTAIDADGPPLT